ncbi:hypothetical protein CCH79_00011745, partial [Gambusia affinis]
MNTVVFHGAERLPNITDNNRRLSFHALPSDPDLKRRWLVNICCDKFKLIPHGEVCGLHFTPSQLLHSSPTTILVGEK